MWLCIFTVILSLACITNSSAQSIPFSSDKWDISARETRVENYFGRESLYLKGGQAIFKDADFKNGVIEFDIAFSGKRGFMGVIFRVQDSRNFEDFYMRPHQSGKPDANQYTPVFNGDSGWQLYHGEGYGAAIKYNLNNWMPVKLVVSGKRAEIYIMDMESPVLVTHDLKREIAAGKIGFKAGNLAPAHFSNFRFQNIDNPELKGVPPKVEKASETTILSWQVSNNFPEKFLDQKHKLSKQDKESLSWQKFACEETGVANLARLQSPRDGKNTVFAKVVIRSDHEQIKKIQFGFSDRIRVFFNDRLLYSGNNNYASRDFRFLGTIGFFDELYLPLKKGENQLWMAVSEDFGGWGLLAKLENFDGVKIQEGIQHSSK